MVDINNRMEIKYYLSASATVRRNEVLDAWFIYIRVIKELTRLIERFDELIEALYLAGKTTCEEYRYQVQRQGIAKANRDYVKSRTRQLPEGNIYEFFVWFQSPDGKRRRILLDMSSGGYSDETLREATATKDELRLCKAIESRYRRCRELERLLREFQESIQAHKDQYYDIFDEKKPV